MECQGRREQARDHQHVHGRFGPGTEVVAREQEVHPLERVGARQFLEAVDPERRRGDPGHEPVEDPEEGHREVGGARNGPRGVLRLLRIDRRALEAEERAQRHHEHAAGPGVEHPRRRERFEAEVARPLGREHCDRDRQQDQHLGAHQHAEHLRADRDLAVPQHADHGDADERVDRPVQVDPGQVGDRRLRVEPEEAEEPEADQRVRDERDDRGADRGRPPEPASDEGVERPGAAHVPREGRQSGSARQVDETREDVGARGADPAEPERERGRARHDRERRGGRDHEEDDVGDAE